MIPRVLFAHHFRFSFDGARFKPLFETYGRYSVRAREAEVGTIEEYRMRHGAACLRSIGGQYPPKSSALTWSAFTPAFASIARIAATMPGGPAT